MGVLRVYGFSLFFKIFFLLTCTFFFKVFIEYVTILLLFYILVFGPRHVRS